MKCYTKGKKPCNERVIININQLFKARERLQNIKNDLIIRKFIAEKIEEKDDSND